MFPNPSGVSFEEFGIRVGGRALPSRNEQVGVLEVLDAKLPQAADLHSVTSDAAKKPGATDVLQADEPDEQCRVHIVVVVDHVVRDGNLLPGASPCEYDSLATSRSMRETSVRGHEHDHGPLSLVALSDADTDHVLVSTRPADRFKCPGYAPRRRRPPAPAPDSFRTIRLDRIIPGVDERLNDLVVPQLLDAAFSGRIQIAQKIPRWSPPAVDSAQTQRAIGVRDGPDAET